MINSQEGNDDEFLFFNLESTIESNGRLISCCIYEMLSFLFWQPYVMEMFDSTLQAGLKYTHIANSLFFYWLKNLK